MTSWSSRKEIVGKMCKWAKRARVALALRRAGARNRQQRGARCREKEKNASGKKMLTEEIPRGTR